jgi:hypothetical protein
MGNSIEDYRAAIGLFHIRIKGNRRPFKFNFPVYSYQEILLTNFRCTFVVVSLSLLQSLNPNIDIIFLLFVLQYILIIDNVEACSLLYYYPLGFNIIQFILQEQITE